MQTNRLPIKPKTNAWHLIYDARSKQICGAIQGCGECGGGRRQQNEIETTASKGNSNGSCYLCQPITINSVCIEMIKLRSQLMVSLFCYTENRLTDRLIQANRQKTIDKSATKSCVCWDYANDTKWILAMHNISVTIPFNALHTFFCDWVLFKVPVELGIHTKVLKTSTFPNAFRFRQFDSNHRLLHLGSQLVCNYKSFLAWSTNGYPNMMGKPKNEWIKMHWKQFKKNRIVLVRIILPHTIQCWT